MPFFRIKIFIINFFYNLIYRNNNTWAPIYNRDYNYIKIFSGGKLKLLKLFEKPAPPFQFFFNN